MIVLNTISNLITWSHWAEPTQRASEGHCKMSEVCNVHQDLLQFWELKKKSNFIIFQECICTVVEKIRIHLPKTSQNSVPHRLLLNFNKLFYSSLITFMNDNSLNCLSVQKTLVHILKQSNCNLFNNTKTKEPSKETRDTTVHQNNTGMTQSTISMQLGEINCWSNY